MSRPTLTVVRDNVKPPVAMDGRDVLDAIAPVIAERLPNVQLDDPWRSTLERLLRAARHARGDL